MRKQLPRADDVHPAFCCSTQSPCLGVAPLPWKSYPQSPTKDIACGADRTSSLVPGYSITHFSKKCKYFLKIIIFRLFVYNKSS